MVCFNCAYKLPSKDISECPLCGMKLPKKCNACDALNPLMAKFCLNCGAEISLLNNHSTIQNNDILFENRKNVAVIFADVGGFTTLSEQMDPEEVREVINDCFEYITRPVYELEGTIDKYMGDCVMILFGARYTHHDDSNRAVLCAMKMQKLIQAYSQEVVSIKGINLEISIGINYGLVVTGKVGNYFDKDYTVMGDVVNVAQRLQASAEKGSILVSESVYLETKDVIQYSSEKEIIVKNKSRAVKCYTPLDIIGNNNAKARILIGREVDITILKDIYENKACKKAITLVGETGIGKTALLKELLRNIHDDMKMIWVNCNPSYQNRVYSTVANIIFLIISTHHHDSNAIKKKRLMLAIEYLLDCSTREEIQRNYNFISLLVGLDRDYDFQTILNAMRYEDIREEILNQLNVFFERVQKKYETLIIVDGLQWSDVSSIDMIKELISRNVELRKLFIFATRYGLDGISVMDEEMNHLFKVERLDDNKAKEFACLLLNCTHISDDTFDLIKRLTNGNPLYIIELLNSIKRKEQYYFKNKTLHLDESQIEHIPKNIESLILGNMSELDEKTMTFLETASVVGNEFSFSRIQSLLGNTMDEAEIVNILTGRNIISLSTIEVIDGNINKNYRFKEEFTREVIYESILNKKKKDIHRNIGELLEKNYSVELQNYYETLALHFEKAGVDHKAQIYCYKSGLKHKDNFNLRDSLAYYKKYLEKAETQYDVETNIELNVLIDIGYIYTILTDYDNALIYLNRALEASLLTNDSYGIKIMMATIYKEQGLYQEALQIIDEISLNIRATDNLYGKILQLKCNILRILGNSKVLSLVKESEKILLEKRDYENLSETMNEAGILYFIQGDIDRSVYYLNKAYNHAEKANNLRVMSKISGNLGIIYHASGLISRALEKINNTISISKKISNTLDYMIAINNLGIIYLEMGKFDKAEVLFNESIKKSTTKSLPYRKCIALTNLADLMFEKGEDEKAISLYEQSYEIALNLNLPIEMGINYLGKIKLCIRTKRYSEMQNMLERCYKIFNEADEISYLCEYYRYLSMYQMINSQIVQAKLSCENSIKYAIESKSEYRKLKALRLKGIILAEEGGYDEALEVLMESIKLSQQLESNYELAKGYYQQFLVLSKKNLKQEAYESFLKARESIAKTDNNIWLTIIEETFDEIKRDVYTFEFNDIS